MKAIAVHTTVSSEELARTMARALVERRLVACAHVDAIESHYLWKGAVQQDQEWRLVCKTVAGRYQAVEQAIRELHPYEVPAIYATELVEVFAPYETWLIESTEGAGPTGSSP